MPGTAPAATSAPELPAPAYDWRRAASRFAILILVYAVVVYVIPRPEGVKPEGWRLAGLFIATIAGLLLEPIPGAQWCCWPSF